MKYHFKELAVIVVLQTLLPSLAHAQATWLKCSNERTTKIVEIDLKEMKLITFDSDYEQFLKKTFPERHASNPNAGKDTYKIFSATDSMIKARTTLILTRNLIELNRYTLGLNEYWMSDGNEYSQKLACQKLDKGH